MELAHQLCQPHGPYSKSLVARALGIARATLYHIGKQAEKDKQVAVEISQWHEQDDTLGHRKLYDGPIERDQKKRGCKIQSKHEHEKTTYSQL